MSKTKRIFFFSRSGCREETEDRSVHVEATKTPHARIHHEAGWLFCRDGHR